MRHLDLSDPDRRQEGDPHLRSLSWIDQANEPVVALARQYPAGLSVPRHSHTRAQLWFARRGIVLVSTDDQRWMIPPGHALIIPANAWHFAEMISAVEMQSLYVEPMTEKTSIPRVVEVTPLGRNLIDELVDQDTKPVTERRLALVQELLLDEFQHFPERPLGLPFPHDRKLAKLCRQFLEAPSARTSIDEWASAMGVARRSFTRHFRAQTGLSFVAWRQQACLLASLPRLAEGEAVTNVALDAGYENIAAFSTMFRRVLGRSPSTYLKSQLP
ncbi:helix-turn-helix domain-containing protein [Rhizobium sp. SSA_523]|uniref:AraC family transcriptional regulator n=1 Tax=Rhizobium sp. SSA_523 TaxID=2952477 RepID=UPI0020904E84|nr:helix-turn-helix transcriptional regulator [Rhizobium sp. SSA_523]MCO5732320.1 helix-turn-helix transcriptional regulator [Rhizobium sp. SSA_523]WKC21278.1 helix-turn-helix transcriptional regulator [Rhizobium sp. SSA_523]